MRKQNKHRDFFRAKTRMGYAFRKARYAPVPSLRSAFRGVEWVVAGTFSGASLCKMWVQRLMAAMTTMKIPYRGKKLSALFSMMAGRKQKQQSGPHPTVS